MTNDKDPRGHWERVYTTKAVDAVSWFAPHLDRSLALIRACGLGPDSAIIDVGGGASTLVDDLLADGHRDVSVLDVSAAAIAATQARLGPKANDVTWIVDDITRVVLPAARYDLWHDRAVFHFLTTREQRERYVERVIGSVRPGGHVIVATFGPNGPERCSGLEVARYAPEAIHAEFGPSFEIVGSDAETHRTPWGSEQEFVYCYCRVGGSK